MQKDATPLGVRPLGGLQPAALLRLGLAQDAFPSAIEIPGYQLLDSLGCGGSGEVFRAFQESLEREVAVKVLRSDLPAASWMQERFEREARMLANLQHPNLVAVHDCLRLGEDRLAMVMEFVRGGSLRNRLRSSPEGLPVPQVIAWALDIARALEAAHAAGIIHRDLKPENVLIDDLDRARVTDFGIALSTLAADRYTTKGAAIGTPGYMAPEQSRGGPVDVRTDVFALGVMLYEMLTGEAPQGAFRRVREVRKEVPRILEDLTMAALRPEPEQRPAGMGAMIERLSAAQSNSGGGTFTRRAWLGAGLACGAFALASWGSRRFLIKDGETLANAAPWAPRWQRIAWPRELEAAAISGTWSRQQDSIVSGNEVCILPVARELPAAWIIRLRFRRLRGDTPIAIFFRTPFGVTSCVLDAWSRGIGGLSSIGGQTLQERDGFVFPVANDRTYEWMLELKRNRVRIWLDGEMKQEIAISGQSLEVVPEWNWQPGADAPTLALGSWKNPVRFESLEWRAAD